MMRAAGNLLRNGYAASVFADALRIIGVGSVVISRKIVKRYLHSNIESSAEMLNTIANAVLLGKIRICRENAYGIPAGFYKNILLLYDVKKHTEAEFRFVDLSEDCRYEVTRDAVSLFLYMYPKTPVLLFDAILWELHHEDEKRKALKQFAILISTLRRRLTNLNAILISPPIELIDLVKKMGNAIEINDGSVYTNIDPSKTVILDPYSDEELSARDVFENQYFIIGLIVDSKFSRPYATYMLKLLRRINCKRRAIKLYGSTVGVPKEVNKIVDILLDVRLNGLSLEDAIIGSMGIDDKIDRMVHDIMKHLSEDGVVDEQYVRKLSMTYGVDEAQFEKMYRKIKRLLTTTG